MQRQPMPPQMQRQPMPPQIQVIRMPMQMQAPMQRTTSQPADVEADCCLKSACRLTNCCVTFFLCYLNIGFCAGVSLVVMKTEKTIGIIFMIVTVLWNLGCTIRVCKRCRDERDLKKTCWASCLSIVALSAASFTFITRYHYFKVYPSNPNQQDTSLLAHKMGLISLVCGIPVMYGCKLDYLMHDKKMIYRVIVDFIDIYEMAEILTYGAETCTGIVCTPPTNTALTKNGWLEIIVQVLCSVSFLTFFVLYGEAMKEGDRNSEFLQKFTRITRLVQDIPFFAIRLLVWGLYGFNTDQFIFLVKNMVTMGLIALEFSCATCGGVAIFKKDEETDQTSEQHVNEGMELAEVEKNDEEDGRDKMDVEEPDKDLKNKNEKKKKKKEKRNQGQPVNQAVPQQRYAIQQGQPVNPAVPQQRYVIQQAPGMPALSAEQQRMVLQTLSAQGYTGQPIIINQPNQGFVGVPAQQMVRQ